MKCLYCAVTCFFYLASFGVFAKNGSLKSAKATNIWVDSKLSKDFTPYGSESEKRYTYSDLSNPSLIKEIYPYDQVGKVFVTAVIWGEDIFKYDYESPYTIDYTSRTASKSESKVSSKILKSKDSIESILKTEFGSSYNSELGSVVASALVVTAAKATFTGITKSEITRAYQEQEFFFQFLEDEFRYATRGLLGLEVKVLGHLDYSTKYDYSDSSFLGIHWYDSGVEGCTFSDASMQANCLRNAELTYGDFLKKAGYPRMYYFEKLKGNENSSSMYADVTAYAESLGWTGFNDSVLVIVGGGQIDALGFHKYSNGTSYVADPVENYYAGWDFPYRTEYYSKYALADEIVHEVGHAMGLSHDCEDSDGNAISESECDYITSVMAHQRARPDTGHWTGGKSINRFSECDIKYLQEKYVTSKYFGGPVKSAISDFECNKK